MVKLHSVLTGLGLDDVEKPLHLIRGPCEKENVICVFKVKEGVIGGVDSGGEPQTRTYSFSTSVMKTDIKMTNR